MVGERERYIVHIQQVLCSLKNDAYIVETETEDVIHSFWIAQECYWSNYSEVSQPLKQLISVLHSLLKSGSFRSLSRYLKQIIAPEVLCS